MNPIKIPNALLILAFLVSSNVLADATVNFSGTLIEAPPCVVNNNKVITVDFGNEVMTTRLDGTQYRKLIDFDLDCSMAASSKQKIRITGASANFDSTVLAGGKTGLGIALYNGNTRLNVGTWVDFTDPNIPLLYAAPVKQNGVTLSGGPFRVMASLVVEYQ
ncbi:fimbrial protein [Klebsiella oxytoca]|uniref:Fimbrial protein n=1 Tax=Klebsiella oxytoca TaxID=571 RepID=A0A6B8MPN4_KLEOX|nr:fimbrial protein [Klebsiella oxytoca]QGN36344.1 fimbrial protein [Klebsiella oxytoca]